jgi:glycosyltransferase involved in cell wall biosynthesis
LEAAIDQAGLRRRFHFLGWQATPDAALHASDVILLPSIWEGCPRVLLEAHAAGLPSVGSDICGIREVIVANETGLVAKMRDAAGFADALATLAEDRLLRERMGQAARRRAEAHFDSARNNREIIDVYRALLGAAPSRTSRHAA